MDDETARPPTTTRRGRRSGSRAALALGGLLTLAVLAAACTGGSSRPGVAAISETTTTMAAAGTTGSGSSGSSGQTAQEQQLQFSRCMRAQGISTFPDPSANGGLLQAISAAGINTRAPAYQAALQACRKYTPAGTETPAQSAADNAKGLEFSQCMRAHGVPNFPDPVMGPTGAPVINLSPGHIDPTSPSFQAANSTCQKVVPGTK